MSPTRDLRTRYSQRQTRKSRLVERLEDQRRRIGSLCGEIQTLRATLRLMGGGVVEVRDRKVRNAPAATETGMETMLVESGVIRVPLHLPDGWRVLEVERKYDPMKGTELILSVTRVLKPKPLEEELVRNAW